MNVTVIGAGLAGCECALALARHGHLVELCEMRPVKSTAAHQTSNLGELVCSNSFRSAAITNAVGLLKAEMKMLGSAVIACAEGARVPAGDAFAVDRERFAAPLVTWADHGGPFVAAVENGPLAATQFHPEKSGDAGAQLLTNWVTSLR